MQASAQRGEFDVGRAVRVRKPRAKKGKQVGEGVLGEMAKIGLSSVGKPIVEALAEKLGKKVAKKIRGEGMLAVGSGRRKRVASKGGAVPGTMQKGSMPVQMPSGGSFKLAGQGEPKKKKKAVIHLPL